MAPRIFLVLWLLRCALLGRLGGAVGQGQPTVYCVALVTPGGYEPHMLAGQHELKAGIFECDDFAIVSNVSAAELFAGHDNLLKQVASKVYTINTTLFAPMVAGPPGFDPSSPKELGEKSAQHLANTPIFLHFWKAITDDGQFEKYSFTVKVDVDTVLLPARLSGVLSHRPARAEFFLNTDRDMYGNFLHGPVEILSKDAMKIFKRRSKECEQKIPKLAYGEDFWMNECLKQLEVPAVSGLPVLYDQYSYGPYGKKYCGALVPDTSRGNKQLNFPAYHPYKNFQDWMVCRMQTGEWPPYPQELQSRASGKAGAPIPQPQPPSRLFSIFQTIKANGSTTPVVCLLAVLSAALVLSFVCRTRSWQRACRCDEVEFGLVETGLQEPSGQAARDAKRGNGGRSARSPVSRDSPSWQLLRPAT